MDKISRILPPSRRVTTVDVESNQPVRPGAPEFGRPMKNSSLDVADRVSLSSLANNRAPEPPATYKNVKESARAKAVEDIAEKFFNPRSAVQEDEGPFSEETLKNIEQNSNYKNIPIER